VSDDTSAQAVWEQVNPGWRFCGLSLAACKAACIAMGTCAELSVAANGCCYPAASTCVGDKRTSDTKFFTTDCDVGPPSPPPALSPPPPSPSPPPPAATTPSPPPLLLCWEDATFGDFWCGGTHPGQAGYTQQSGSALGIGASSDYVWEKKGAGWRFCGLSLEECKAACSAMGACAELIVSGNGCCYPATSRCVGIKRTNDLKLVTGTCQALPPPPPFSPPPPIPHYEWTSLSSLPSIAIADAEQPDAFLARCKGTCLDETSCVGFTESGCDEAGCALCEFKSASTDSYVLPASHIYLWLGGTSRKSSYTSSARAANLHVSYDEYDDGATSVADGAASPLARPNDTFPSEAGQFTFSAKEIAAGISVAVLSGVLIGNLLALACIRCCRGRCGLRKRRSLPHLAQPSVPFPHYFVEKSTIPVPQCPGANPLQSTASSGSSSTLGSTTV